MSSESVFECVSEPGPRKGQRRWKRRFARAPIPLSGRAERLSIKRMLRREPREIILLSPRVPAAGCDFPTGRRLARPDMQIPPCVSPPEGMSPGGEGERPTLSALDMFQSSFRVLQAPLPSIALDSRPFAGLLRWSPLGRPVRGCLVP